MRAFLYITFIVVPVLTYCVICDVIEHWQGKGRVNKAKDLP
jgi:hypothetical protein